MDKNNCIEQAKEYRTEPEQLKVPKEMNADQVASAMDDGYTELSRQDTVDTMIDRGMKIVIPADNQLQIDIDSEEDYTRFLRALECMKRNFINKVKEVEIHPSKSGFPRRHITVTLWSTYSPMERIMYQAMLGSDPVREINNYRRFINQDIYPIAFFEPMIQTIPRTEVVETTEKYCNFCTDPKDDRKYYEIRSTDESRCLVVQACEKCAAELGRKFYAGGTD